MNTQTTLQDILRLLRNLTGREDIYPEMPVRVSGFKRVIDEQAWLISKVTHSLNNNGFTTGVELEVRLSDVEYEAEADE